MRLEYWDRGLENFYRGGARARLQEIVFIRFSIDAYLASAKNIAIPRISAKRFLCIFQTSVEGLQLLWA